MSDDLTAWLREQLDEDERVARAAGAKWYTDSDGNIREDAPDGTSPYVACGSYGGGLEDAYQAHIARHDPARVLAEVAAKRAILDDCAEYVNDGTVAATDGLAGRTLIALAQPYADRPGWREEWRA
nr:DUF6221 family protein [Micromonospora sp. DSM 115978]